MDWLHGKQFALTGKFASMSQPEVTHLIEGHGGKIAATVNGKTAFVVVGQETWPLEDDGRLSRQLQKAQELHQKGQRLEILSEEDFLARLGQQTNGVHRHYSIAQLIRLLGVSRARVRAWMRAGLIQPSASVRGAFYFDFRQVVSAKTLCDLTNAGISTDRIRLSLEQLRTWIGDAEKPLEQLALLEKNGQLLVRLEQGLVEPSGQMYLDFVEDGAILQTQPDTARQWFETGCQYEDEGSLQDALHAYRQALLIGGAGVDVCFNLANVLFGLERKGEASERYRQVVEMDCNHAQAWNNLGVALSELGNIDEAIDAFQTAIRLGYLDAHYNLADLLDSSGQKAKARNHWLAYLKHDPHGEWSRYARSKLG